MKNFTLSIQWKKIQFAFLISITVFGSAMNAATHATILQGIYFPAHYPIVGNTEMNNWLGVILAAECLAGWFLYSLVVKILGRVRIFTRAGRFFLVLIAITIYIFVLMPGLFFVSANPLGLDLKWLIALTLPTVNLGIFANYVVESLLG